MFVSVAVTVFYPLSLIIQNRDSACKRWQIKDELPVPEVC